MRNAVDVLVELSKRQGLGREVEKALGSLPFRSRRIEANEDVLSQGDYPKDAILVVDGMLASYHTGINGVRNYLSLHIRGDMPDLQSMFFLVSDHSLCALNAASIALFQHDKLWEFCLAHPRIAGAFWRTTLIDAAIFRQAIVRRGSPEPVSRLANLFCEQYLRAKNLGASENGSCDLPLSQVQLAQKLGLSHISVNRALQKLRSDEIVVLAHGKLTVLDWAKLVAVGQFDPSYLHLRNEENGMGA